MKLFLIDPAGLGLDLSVQALSLGHEVRHFIADGPKTVRIGERVVNRVRSIADNCRWADVVFITDNAKYLKSLDAMRTELHDTVFVGPTYDQAQWEVNRKVGQDLLQHYDIPIAPYQIFHNYDSAVAYIKKRDARLVSKPYGGDVDKALSYVAKGPEDMLYMLERWKKLGKLKFPFILQDFIKGVEFGVEGWFNGEDWTGEWHENFEHKKFMNDDVGMNTGEMGTVQLVVTKSVIADRLLKPLTAHLKAEQYVGFFDVNCIVDNKGRAWPLEITARPGWPTLNLQTSLFRGDFVETLRDEKAIYFTRDRVCTGVVITIPDYPYSQITRREVIGIPVWGFEPDNGHFHPCEMMVNQSGQWVTAGDYVCVVTGHGSSVSKSREEAYINLKSLSLPNSPMYRTDIGKKLEKELPLLREHGLAKSWRY